MKKLFFPSIVFLGLLGGGTSRADLTLGTSNSPGSPLDMSAGTTSGPMLVNVVSNNFPNDIMAAWQFVLAIAPETGASGTLTFQDPGAGMTFPTNPTNYVFGSNGLGITAINTNSGSSLSAFDFLNPSASLGVPVPGSPGANLLQMDFLASSNASGLFGIYALEGAQNTIWTDSNANTQYFTNVPSGAGMVEIGQVLISASAVPEPSSFWMMFSALGLGAAGRACWKRRRRRAGK